MLDSDCELRMQSAGKTKTRFFLPLCSFVSLVVCFLASGCAGEPKHPTWKNVTGAEQHERLMWQAVRDKDWTNLERHLSPTFIGVSADGQVFDRGAWLQHWQSAQVTEFSLGEVQVQPEGPDLKVTYIFHAQGTGIGATPASGLRAVSVWQQIKGRWELTATTLTPILK
jgi:ketosteroid isomerase-like protein